MYNNITDTCKKSRSLWNSDYYFEAIDVFSMRTYIMNIRNK